MWYATLYQVHGVAVQFNLIEPTCTFKGLILLFSVKHLSTLLTFYSSDFLLSLTWEPYILTISHQLHYINDLTLALYLPLLTAFLFTVSYFLGKIYFIFLTNHI